MNTTVEQSAPVEFRMTGGTLTGTAIRYGERAQDRAEMFLPGSFISGLDTAALNLQHDREHVIAEQPDELAFTNSVRSLALRAQLRPDSAEARLVSRGALRGLSVEFVAIKERQDRGLRVISKAHLAGVGLVDSGSYRTEVEIRQRMAGAWFRATIPTERTMQCRCQGPTCTDVTFDQGAFVDVGEGGDVLAVGGGGFSNVLGSLKRGTLLVCQTKKGLQVGLTNRETDTARRIAESGGVAPIYARPILDLDASDFVDEGTTRRFTRAQVRAILIKSTDADQGHIPAEIEGIPLEARRRLWL